MKTDRRGTTLIEVLGAVLILVLLGSMVTASYLGRIAFLEDERERSEVRMLGEALERQLVQAHAAAGPGATSLAWHFEGIADSLQLPSSGTRTFPETLQNLSKRAPRWLAYPVGRPERAKLGTSQDAAGGRWLIVAPIGGLPEADPSTVGWDKNDNGLVDRPDHLLSGQPLPKSGLRRLSYRFEISADATVTVKIYRGLSPKSGEMAPGPLLETRIVELR